MRTFFFSVTFVMFCVFACAAPKVRAPKVKPASAAPVRAATLGGEYQVSWTNIEVRSDGSATLRVDIAGKHSQSLQLVVNATCTELTDQATQKVAMRPTAELCAYIKGAKKALDPFVDACVASGVCAF